MLNNELNNDEGQEKLFLIIIKEFYRFFLLGMTVFWAYFLLAHSRIFSMDNDLKNMVIKFIYLAAALLMASVFVKSMNIFFWDNYKRRKNIQKVPGLLKTGLNLLIYMITIFIVLRVIFAISIDGLLTASGAMGIVIGLALKELISDIFAGVIIGVDKYIKIGDFVMLEVRPYSVKVGFISDMDWRTISITTPENTLVVVPNSLITKNMITNLSEPVPEKEFELIFTFDFDVAPERILRVLHAALYQTPEILQDPAPKARVSKISGTGVEYKVKYLIRPAQIGPGKARHFVLNNILYNLAQAGLSMSYPKTDVYNSSMPQRNLDIRNDRIGLLKKIELFSVLSINEISEIAARLVERPLKKDEFIVRFGETGTSMYILLEGLLNVYILDSTTNTEIKVAQLKPGSYFGEMSLLTGEPRTASISAFSDSVMFELPKESIDIVLRGNPNLVLALSGKIAETKLKNELVFLNRDDQEKANNHAELSNNIFNRIKKFFLLG